MYINYMPPIIQQTGEKEVHIITTDTKVRSDPNTTGRPPSSLKQILITEEKRYKSKGYGLIAATLIAASYFYWAPILCKTLWPVLLSYGLNEWVLSVGLTLLWHYTWLITANLVLYIIYHIEHPFFERYKATKRPWPWHENKEEWRKILHKSIKFVAFNNFVALPATLLACGFLKGFTAVPYSVSAEDLPDHLQFIVCILFQVICEDMILYFVHKWLHHPSIYPYIHKRHHEFINPVGISAEYSHPIEFLLITFLPNAIISTLLGKRMHLSTMLMYNFAREFETHDGHCGYEFSWSPYRLIPFSTSSTYHDFHHSHNIGNYSSYLTFWDTIEGNNLEFYKYQN
jgi:sterol desaturase/sphingolipid hydroxylase (fatty acid hydroxylase superfamily)